MLERGWREGRGAVNGIELHWVEAGPPEGTLLILLHGFPEFWWGWRHQITPLAEAGFRVVAPDMRGYNESTAPEGIGAYHIDILADDIAALASHLGQERFLVVGHDWGGLVAWWVGARYGARLEKLVILDAPHPDIFPKQLRRHPSQALKSAYALFFQLPRLPEMLLGANDFASLKRSMAGTARRKAFEPGAIERYTEAWRKGSLTGMLNYYRALRLRRPKAPARIGVPTLVLWGERDPFLEHHMAEASVALCDDGRLSIIPGTTHWLHLEEPERITGALLGFLREEPALAS